jgi:hypothetical protein
VGTYLEILSAASTSSMLALPKLGPSSR